MKSYHGKFLSASSTGEANADGDYLDESAKFTVKDLGDNIIALQSSYGNYFHSEDESNDYEVNANRSVQGPWDIYRVEWQWDKKVALKTAQDRYITAENDGSLSGNRKTVQGWETFSPICTGKITGNCLAMRNRALTMYGKPFC